MNYPLYGNYIAYDNHLVGITNIIKYFNGFTELQDRKDAGEKLLDYYEGVDIDKIALDSRLNKGLGLVKLGYIELLLSSEEMSPLLTSHGDRLMDIAENNIIKKIEYNDVFSEESIRQSISLTKSKNSKDIVTVNRENVSTITIITRGGQQLTALIRPEATQVELNQRNQSAIITYPLATYLATSSDTYNCHAYAWRMSDGYSACWINKSESFPPDDYSNLEKYWTNDYYWSALDISYATKVFYPLSDHSAIVHSSTHVDSKWSDGPLMRHPIGYGPYNNMNTTELFTHYTYNHLLNCSNGNGATEVGVSSVYTPPTLQPNVEISSYQWSVLDGAGRDAIELGKANISTSGPQGSIATISFNRMGLYEIYLETYRDSNSLISSFWFEAVVE